jgi:hypothetical protein
VRQVECIRSGHLTGAVSIEVSQLTSGPSAPLTPAPLHALVSIDECGGWDGMADMQGRRCRWSLIASPPGQLTHDSQDEHQEGRDLRRKRRKLGSCEACLPRAAGAGERMKQLGGSKSAVDASVGQQQVGSGSTRWLTALRQGSTHLAGIGGGSPGSTCGWNQPSPWAARRYSEIAAAPTLPASAAVARQ